MRLCRFRLEDLVLSGFFADDRVIPIDQAAEAYSQTLGIEIELPSTDNLLDLLPLGDFHEPAKRLSNWIDGLDAPSLAELTIPLDDLELLTPIGEPKKILLLAGNYAEHVVERGGTTAEREETFPYVFMKPPSTTLNHPGAPVLIPKISPDHVDWECELGVIIGRACKDVDESEALDYVAGYTIVNDITDRKFTPNPNRKPRERDKFFDWLHGKWHDTFCPVGPCVTCSESVGDPQKLSVQLTVNDALKQNGSTGQMVFPVAAIIAFLSKFVTVEPGDVLSTGTPSGVGSASGTYLKAGDVVRATIEKIGTLENPIVDAIEED